MVYAPRRRAVLAGLAEEEPNLLQALGEGISARHLDCCSNGLAGDISAQLVVDVVNPKQAGSGLSWLRSNEADRNGA
jgi:hypothetical protein